MHVEKVEESKIAIIWSLRDKCFAKVQESLKLSDTKAGLQIF